MACIASGPGFVELMALVAEAKELPALSQAEEPFAAPAPVFSAHRGESSEDYPRIVARLNGRLRVIEGACGLQWLLQYRKSATRWETIAYCATKAGLRLRIHEHLREAFHRHERQLRPLEKLVALHCDPAAWALVEALPDYHLK